jgi:hypothetical protein
VTKKWVVGMMAVLAVAALVGVGYSAFTATATVNGTATAGLDAIQVSSSQSGACFYPSGAPAPGSFGFSLNAKDTVLTLSVTNMVPGAVCSTVATISNVGSVPVVLSNQLNTTSGICVGPALNCYDVSDTAGLSSVTGIKNVNSIATLGSPYADTINVWIPAGSTSAPSSGVFSIYYVGSAGI